MVGVVADAEARMRRRAVARAGDVPTDDRIARFVLYQPRLWIRRPAAREP